jgi:hypothetical protein
MLYYAYLTECDFVISMHESRYAFRYDYNEENGEKILPFNIPADRKDLLDHYNFRDGYEWYNTIYQYRIEDNT